MQTILDDLNTTRPAVELTLQQSRDLLASQDADLSKEQEQEAECLIRDVSTMLDQVRAFTAQQTLNAGNGCTMGECLPVASLCAKIGAALP